MSTNLNSGLISEKSHPKLLSPIVSASSAATADGTVVRPTRLSQNYRYGILE